MLGRTGTEMQVLEAPFDGQVLYDAASGNVYVGTLAAKTVADQYPCSQEGFSYLPLYAQNPGCRDIGSYPDRELVVVRPATTNTGYIFGHNHVCPAGPGLLPELQPVEIDPADLPSDIPDGLYTISYLKTPSNDACAPATPTWYRTRGFLPLDRDQVGTSELTYAELQDATDAVNFALWKLIDGKWNLVRLTNESFKTIIGDNSPTTLRFLGTRQQVLYQHVSSNPGSMAHLTYFPAIAPPGPLPIVNMTEVVDLTVLPEYYAEATFVKMEFYLKGTTADQRFDCVLVCNGIEYSRIALPYANAGECCIREADIPIPSDKRMTVAFYIQIAGGSTPGTVLSMVHVIAFGR